MLWLGASDVALLGMVGLLRFVVGACVDQAREGMIDIDS
jgi:hypothetical protein